jgi:pyruvate/2-oxoglutarate dehydrogenase complex dihydrolipoamide dehydrogenase (E3) component
MSQREQFDVLILGSGGGGKLTAWHMAGSGRRTAVVERKWIGGSCPNIACLPSKNEIRSAEIAHLARNAEQFGAITGPMKVDMAKVVRRKRDMVQALVDAHLRNYKTSGAELIMGSGRFVAPKTLEVSLNEGGTRTLVGDKVFLNLGTHAAIPNVPGLEAAKPLTHIEALELDILPAHLIVIGGGYAGLELAQAYRRFGSEVTVVEAGPQLMGREDADASHEIRRILTDEGIQIQVPAELLKVSGRSGQKVRLIARTSSGEQTIEGSHILVPASTWTSGALLKSTSGLKRARQTSGRSANAPAARCSPTYPKTTFASFATIWPVGGVARATGSFPTVCSPTRRLRTLD